MLAILAAMDHSVNHVSLSLHAAGATGEAEVALCGAIGFSSPDNAAPDWVHLLPAGTIRTADGRGPYRVTDGPTLIAVSLQGDQRLVIDENHATDLAAPKGLPAPAMGWVVELQNRQDGIWGKVEWTDAGRQLVSSRSYRALSPVIAHDKAGNIEALLRASLVNKPNLRGLKTLHQESPDMKLLEKLLAALGLPTDTSEDTLIGAVATLHAQQKSGDADRQVALQAQLDPVAEAAGLARGAKAQDVIAAIRQLVASGGDQATIVALQAELKNVGDQLVALQSDGKREKAESFVDAAIAKGRVGVKPQRDRYVTLHMADPAGTEAMINDLPAIGGALLTPTAVKVGESQVSLNAEQLAVATMLGLDPQKYAATLAAEQEAL